MAMGWNCTGLHPVPPRYKKVILTIFETHEGDTESDEDSPPPPPPGSPPRYSLYTIAPPLPIMVSP